MSISVSGGARANLRRWTQQATARRRRIDDALNNALPSRSLTTSL
jgi:hypothetical protein